MRKFMSTALAVMITVCLYAQTDLYTSIVNNGAKTKYTEYSAFLNEDGTCNLRSYVKDKLFIELEQIPSGEYVGFSLLWEVEPTNGGRERAGENVLSDYGRAPNYPDVSYIYHTYRKDGYVALDGNIFKIEGISKDGLSFEEVARVYMPEKTEQKEEEKKTDNKKSFKDKLKSVKDAYAEGSGSEGSLSKEAKELQGVNLKEKITDYLKEMKAKYDAHSSAADVLKSQQNIKNARENKDEFIKSFNDSVKATPEYQKAQEVNNMITLRSIGSKTVYYWTKYPGKEMNTQHNAYLSNYGDETKFFCEEKEIYTSDSPVPSSAKLALRITKADCRKTLTIQ